MLKIQNNEIKKTGISSLKIAYNKIFGYYLEVTNAHKDKVPDEWIRKQTLVNSERYITEELKEYEEKILNAEEKIYSIENNLYTDLLNKLSKNILKLQSTSLSIAFLDCLISFSNSAIEYKFCLPTISNDNVIDIKKGRHVIIERSLSPDEVYIPNNVYLDNQSQQIIIITGPNMAGKSALIRQTALIVLLAQIGSYVPAAYAKIGIIDKIFTRVGASDNISMGESTFMVEMTEAANILHNATSQSLVLLDEIGAGVNRRLLAEIGTAIQRLNEELGYTFCMIEHDLDFISRMCRRVIVMAEGPGQHAAGPQLKAADQCASKEAPTKSRAAIAHLLEFLEGPGAAHGLGVASKFRLAVGAAGNAVEGCLGSRHAGFHSIMATLDFRHI